METIATNEVREITWPGKTFITVREVRPFDELTTFFTKNYSNIYEAIYKQGLKVKEPPCAIYYSVDENKKVTDLAAAIPVTTGGPLAIEGFEVIEVPAAKAVTIMHHGSYDGMTSTYEVIQKYVAEKGYTVKWMIEEYLSDPEVEKDPSNWKTNIYFVVGSLGNTMN